MFTQRSIAISGDLGGGKSTVAALLSQRLCLEKISLGDIHREMARTRGLSALEMNRRSERDADIDACVDVVQRELAASGRPLIVDSRLGWHFFPDAMKIQLKADPLVAAARVMERPSGKAEQYATVEDALAGLKERAEIERRRFKRVYGVDKACLRNYDLVCDSTSATPDEIVAAIVEAYAHFTPGTEDGPELFLDPARVLPPEGSGAGRGEKVTVGYAGGTFFAVTGHATIQAAALDGVRLLRARLSPKFDRSAA